MYEIVKFPNQPQTRALLEHLGLPLLMDQAAAQVWMARLAGDHEGQAAGFAVLWPAPSVAKLWLHVVPAFRQQGVGGDLLSSILQQGNLEAPRALRLVSAVEAECAAWFVRRGFNAWGQLHEYSFQIDQSERLLHRLWERLKKTIPPAAEMISLADADGRGFSTEISRLQAVAVGGLATMLLQQMNLAKVSGDDLHVSLDKSLVIVLQGKLVAYSLARFDSRHGCWMIDGMYVAPAFRDAWATIWLRHELVQTGLRLGGSNEYRVQARSDQINTIQFARKLGASYVGGKVLLEKPLPKATAADQTNFTTTPS